jgi:hypothetical protein
MAVLSTILKKYTLLARKKTSFMAGLMAEKYRYIFV